MKSPIGLIFCRNMLMDSLQGQLKMVWLKSLFIELFDSIKGGTLCINDRRVCMSDLTEFYNDIFRKVTCKPIALGL